MPRYTVLSPLSHDRVDYAVGDTIEVAGAAAARLVALGVIVPAEEVPAGKGAAKRTKKGV